MRSSLPKASLALALSLGAPAAAQVGVEGQIVGLKFETLDLIPETVDLVFNVEDLGGGTADLAAPVANLQLTETETEIRIELSGDVLFDFDDAAIRVAAEPVLTGVADVLKQHPDATITIVGFTDAKGSDTYNQRLSQRRAASVKDWLVASGGVGGDKLSTEGLGEANPVAPNANPDGSDNPEGRQKNRRVEIAVRK
jgi:outer membrane protein OmpA-like peptidoglycan-associated protein